MVNVFGAVDWRTPDIEIMEREEDVIHAESLLSAEHDTWHLRQQVFKRLCAHWFSAGPQPEDVLQRVFYAASKRRRDLLSSFSPLEFELARQESAAGREWRLKQLFKGTSEDWRASYRRICSTLCVAFAARHKPALTRITFNEAMGGDSSKATPEASETLSRVLDKLFVAGNHPRQVTQQTFALAGWLFRDLQLNLSLESIGFLFSEGRASQSWRSKTFIEGFLRAAGFSGCNTSWQKPASAVAKYAAAAKGNRNRRKKSASRAPSNSQST